MSQHEKTHKDGKKWCNKGKHYEYIALFGKNNYSKDGRDYTCSLCRREYNKSPQKIKLKLELELKKKKEYINKLFGKSNSTIPKIEWEKLLQTRLVNKSIQFGKDFY